MPKFQDSPTFEVLDELILRFKETNGIQFCTLNQLESLVNLINEQIDDIGTGLTNKGN